MGQSKSSGRTLADAEGAEFLTTAQAAQMVQVCPGTVRGWMRAGKLRRYGEGRIWRVRRVELLKLLEQGSGTEQPSVEARAAAILKKVSH